MTFLRRFTLIIVLLMILAVPVSAQEGSAYAWAEADLALNFPAHWAVPVPAVDGDLLTLALAGENSEIVLAVLPPAQNDAALRAALETRLSALNLLPLSYHLEDMYGRDGLRIEAVSADRAQTGIARAGLMPDNRPLLVVAQAPAAERAALERALRVVLDSLVFSASLPPALPTYRPVWTLDAGEQPVGSVTARDGRVYVLESVGVQYITELDGVRVLDAATGTLINEFPFANPANPTGIAVDAAGIVYVGDTVCRCVRRMSPAGEWLDPLGSFGGNAPYSLAVADDGTVYAVDKADAGYVLRMLGEPLNRTVGLNFNASAPPLVGHDAAGQVWVVEWLNSMMDGAVSGAVSLVDQEKFSVELRFWLNGVTPDAVHALTTTPAGDLALAMTNGQVRFVHPSGVEGEPLLLQAPARALAFDTDGTLFTVQEGGTLRALSTAGVPDHVGGRQLALGVPVQGTFAALTVDPALVDVRATQRWTYAGTAGETITISAVDQSLTDPYMIGMDMALRLLAPDGSELAFDDDLSGDELYSVYDAQIASFTLPQTGTYTIVVEQMQGGGTYTLGVSSPQPLALHEAGVTELTGSLQDVFPAQRLVFDGRAGDVLTFTMSAVTDGLDPVLTLTDSNGELLAFNDDAADPELGVNAQLTQVELPLNGSYMLRTSRYEGVGIYRLVIVRTVPAT